MHGYIYAHVVDNNGLATIKGRYRVATSLWIVPSIFAVYGLYLYVGSVLGYQVLSIIRGDQGWRTMSPTQALVPGLGVPAFLFLLYFLIGYSLRRKHAQQEQEIVDALQRCVADNVQS